MRPSAVFSLSCLALTLLSGPPPCGAAERGPSTPEERQRAVSIARRLEAEPLGPTAKDDRAWVIKWLIEVPDIHVEACTEFLGPLLDSKRNFSSEIFGQMLISDVAYVIEHPDKADDGVSRFAAGLEGALKTYESILKTKPKARWPFLDELIRRRDSGTLQDHVRSSMEKCNAAVKVSTP